MQPPISKYCSGMTISTHLIDMTPAELTRKAETLERQRAALVAEFGEDGAGAIVRYVTAKIDYAKAWDDAVKGQK